MRRTSDLTGKRFGKLLVLNQSVQVYRGKRQSICHCLCDCGSEVDVPASHLCKSDGTAPVNPTRSCGCAKMIGDLAGHQFGRLTVISQSGKNGAGEITWNCVCACGNQKVVSGSQLKLGMVKSCGCLASEHRSNFGSFAKMGSAASHTPEVIAKRAATSFGNPGSEQRQAAKKRLRQSLESNIAIIDGANIPKIIDTKPQSSNPYRGVCWNARKQRWMAYCTVRGIKWQCSRFETPEAAKAERDAKQQELIELTGIEPLIEKRKNRGHSEMKIKNAEGFGQKADGCKGGEN